MKSDDSIRNYRSRMARVVAAIVADPMAEHRLETLAARAFFSPFHFHRLYRSLMGETAMETIRRQRLALAAMQLAERRRSVTDIALAAGYDSPQAFTRAFHQFSGASPRAFQRKIALLVGPGDDTDETEFPLGFDVPVRAYEALQLYGLQHHGPPATIPHTHRHLRQLIGARAAQWYGVSDNRYGACEGHSGPRGGFRYFAAVAFKAGDPVDEGLEAIDIPAGMYASHTVMGPYTQISASIRALYTLWLPDSGYESEDRPRLEVYRNDPRNVSPAALHTDLLIPVRPFNKASYHDHDK